MAISNILTCLCLVISLSPLKCDSGIQRNPLNDKMEKDILDLYGDLLSIRTEMYHDRRNRDDLIIRLNETIFQCYGKCETIENKHVYDSASITTIKNSMYQRGLREEKRIQTILISIVETIQKENKKLNQAKDDREKMMEILTDIQNLKQENKDLKQENNDLNLALKDLNEKMKAESNAQMDIVSRIEKIQDENQNLSQALAVIKEVISFNKGLMTENGKPKQNNETLNQEMTQVNNVPEVMKKNITVSLRGSGYITVPVSEDDLSQSLTTTVNMMIKPTNVDGPVAVIRIKAVASYVLFMKARNPILSILNENGDDVKELHLHYLLNTSRWHRLHLTRYTNNVDVRITDSEDIKAGTRNNLTVTSLPASQAEPAVIYFGGTPEGYPKYGNGNWQGCLAEVAINGRYLNLVQRDSSGVITPLCLDSRTQDLAAGIVFGGSGHVRFPLSTMSTGPVQSVSIDFRTVFKDGLIVFIRNSLQGFQGWVSLKAGHILAEFRTSKGSTIIKSKKNTYSDGKIHELEIEVQQDSTHVSVDTGTDTFEPELLSHSVSFDVHNGLYLAGLPGSQAATDSRFRSLHACIRQVHVNGVNIPFALADEAEDVHYGRCGHGVGLEEWASCFKFSDNSTPIEVPESPQGRS